MKQSRCVSAQYVNKKGKLIQICWDPTQASEAWTQGWGKSLLQDEFQ